MRVVLLNSCVVSRPRDRMERQWSIAQVGTASIAAFLRERGCDVHVLDARLHKDTAETLAARVAGLKPAYVGMTAITEEICDAAAAAEAIKRRDHAITTVIGGPHATALSTQTLEEFDAFDVAVAGEGEIPMAELAGGRPMHAIRGIAYRGENGEPVATPPHEQTVPLDDLPLPAWDLFALHRYQAPVSVEFLRGCPFACSFCFRIHDRQVRYKSPARVLDELEYLARAYPVPEWYFSSNGSWPLGRRHATEICEGILSRGIRMRWCTSTRVDIVDEPLLALMQRAGCTFIDFGIESGDACLLGQSGKGTDPGQAEAAIKTCYRLGIETELDFVIGLPYETPQSLEKTRQLAIRLRPYSTLANLAIFVPFPGTRACEMAERSEGGVRVRTTDWREYTKQMGCAITHDAFPDGGLTRYQGRLYLTYYLGSPRKVLQLLRSRNGRRVLDVRRALQLLGRFLPR